MRAATGIIRYLATASLLLNYAGAQERRSPLARYGGVEAPEVPLVQQAYMRLLDTPRVEMAAPIDERTVLSAAARVIAIQDERFELSPKGQYAIGEKKWVVHYGLASHGIPVAEPTSKMLLIDSDGQPLEVRDRQIPIVLPKVLEAEVDPSHAVEAAESKAAEQWNILFPNVAQVPNWKTTEPVREIWVDDAREGHLAWLVLVRASDVRVPVSLQCWVSATGAPRVLHVVDRIYSSHHGSVVGSVWMTTPLAGPNHGTALAGTIVSRIDAGDYYVTDDLGGFDFPRPYPLRDLIQAGLFGPRCVVMNDAGAELREEAMPLEAENATLDFHTTAEFEVAQVSAFYWVNRAAEFARSKIRGRLFYVPTRVNLNAAGNAFWDGFALNFFRSGDGFPNTAYSDVIIHEFGHAVDGRLGGILSRGYSEGFGDALAILITEQPEMGRDFFGRGNPMRDAREVVKWTAPDVMSGSGEPHRVGQVYAGFVWQLIEELKRAGDRNALITAKGLVLDSAEMNPKDIVDAIRLTYLADDNDGNLANGTPHSAQITAAAKSREIPTP